MLLLSVLLLLLLLGCCLSSLLSRLLQLRPPASHGSGHGHGGGGHGGGGYGGGGYGGRWLVSGADDDTFKVWNMSTSKSHFILSV